ncbi:MAG: hypothetical protein FWD06_07765 [Oscillospiraceae bacterium]|nr:hypothetical protein [Oscillospiraceae bacterium]
MEQYQFQLERFEDFVIPPELRKRKGRIVLFTEAEPKRCKKPTFNAFRVDMSDYKFNREDCYER